MVVELYLPAGAFEVMVYAVDVQADESGVVVAAQVLEGAVVRDLEAGFRSAKRRWEVAAALGGEPPEWPAVAVFSAMSVSLSDDVSTPYRLARLEVGGSGTEWAARWRFTPVPDDGATQITTEVATGERVFRRVDQLG